MNFFCLHTRKFQRTPCVHGMCHLMDYKKPESISEEKDKTDASRR